MSTYKVGHHRGNSRVWIEGEQLAQAGFTVGARINVSYHDNELRVSVVSQALHAGKRRVARKGSKPVLDFNNKATSECFRSGQLVEVDMRDGVMIVRGVES